ncbi:MAG: VCBS domain-containing protein, partial [Pseudomonadota bacterium]
GTWTYTLDQSAVQGLDAGDSVTDTITFTATDGTSQVVTVTINGSEDAAVFGGSATAIVTDGNPADISGGMLSAGGSLTIVDPDGGEAGFVPQTIAAGSNPALGGVLTIDGAGNWSWSAPDGQSSVKTLAAGETITETFIVTSLGGDTHPVTITVTGSNDAPVFALQIGDSAAGAVTEGSFGQPVSANGRVTLSDVDVSETVDVAVSLAGVSGNAGPLTNADMLAMLQAGGNDVIASGATNASVPWNFNTSVIGDPAKAGFDHLAAGETLTLTYTLTATDDAGLTASQPITITITGTGDAAVISGSVTGAVREDMGVVGNNISTSGALIISDADAGEASFQPSTLNAAYGVFAVDAAGSWTYSADTPQPAIAGLGEGETLTDTTTVLAFDGTPQTLSVTITGSNDQPEISVGSGDADTGNVTELAGHVGDTAPGTLQTSGTLTIVDVDATDSVTASVASGVAISGSTGGLSAAEFASMLTVSSPVIGSGATSGALTWSFDTDLSATGGAALAFDYLGAGETLTLTYTIQIVDDSGAVAGANSGATEGTTSSHQLTITITGTNDVATVVGDLSGQVTTAPNSTAPVAVTGQALLTDPDGGQGQFTAETVTGTYGSLTIQPSGNWVFEGSGNQTSLLALTAGQTVTDTFTVTGADGTPATITITLGGADDTAIVTGDRVGLVTEDNSVTGELISTGGTLQAADVDAGQSGFLPGQFQGAYGSLQLDSDGNWTYGADNNAPVIQQLALGDSLTDIITVQTIGGDEVEVSITIMGVNDAPEIVQQIPTLMFADGDDAAISMAGRFADLDNGPDIFTYAAMGLPTGLSIDPLTGDITGTLTSGASDSGPYNVTVRAVDELGGYVDMSFVITATNPAPVEVFKLANEAATANTPFALDVAPAFADGGNDDDVLSFSATGLPTGLSVDPVTGMVTGLIDPSASTGGPDGDGRFVVTIRAADTSGAMVEATLIFFVGEGASAPEIQTPITPSAPRMTAGLPSVNDTGSDGLISANRIVNEVTNDLSDLDGSDELRTDRLVILEAVEDLEGLKGTSAEMSVGVPIADEIAAENRRIERDAAVREALDEGGTQSEWQTKSFAGSVLRMDVGGSIDNTPGFDAGDTSQSGRTDAASGLRDELRVETVLTEKTVIVEIKADLRLSTDASVQSYSAFKADGKPLPPWARMTSTGMMIVEKPAGLETMDIKIVAQLTNGETVERTVTIEVNTGEVSMQQVLADASNGGSQALFSDQLRGTDDGASQRESDKRLVEALIQTP